MPCLRRTVSQEAFAALARQAAADVGSHGDHLCCNAEKLGYHAGAMQAAIGKPKADAKTQGDILSNVFSIAISLGTAAMPGLPMAGKVGAPAFSGQPKQAVRGIVGGVTADAGSLSNTLMDLAVPHAPGQLDRTRGPADPFFFQRSADTVSGANP